MKSKTKTIMFIISMIWLAFSVVTTVLLFTKYTHFYAFGLLIGEFAFAGIAGIIFFILLFLGCQSTYYSQSRYIVLFLGVLWIVLSGFFGVSSFKETFSEHINTTKRYTITLSDGNILLFYERKDNGIYVYRKDFFLVRGLGGFGNKYIDNESNLPRYSYNAETKEITFYGTYRYSDELHEQFPDLEDRQDTFTLYVEK